MNKFPRETGGEPMSNTVGLDGHRVSVADLILQATTGSYFAPKIGGPINANDALDAMFSPVNDGHFSIASQGVSSVSRSDSSPTGE